MNKPQAQDLAPGADPTAEAGDTLDPPPHEPATPDRQRRPDPASEGPPEDRAEETND